MTSKAPPISDCAWMTKRHLGEPYRINLHIIVPWINAKKSKNPEFFQKNRGTP